MIKQVRGGTGGINIGMRFSQEMGRMGRELALIWSYRADGRRVN